ncbi:MULTISPECIES: SPOR domain-containing protein, partial [Brevundimonas]|uniref:SPOR domain-containing protein n=1 Tax=Brevundimonas TaxID=41275 RepID=UPI0025C32AB0
SSATRGPRNVTASLNGAPANAAVAPSTTPRRSASSATREPTRAAPRTPAGRWAVQVGAFREEKVATDWLTEVNRRFRDQFATAERNVQTAGDWYRSRFVGLSETGAKSACEALAARRVTCMVIGPD